MKKQKIEDELSLNLKLWADDLRESSHTGNKQLCEDIMSAIQAEAKEDAAITTHEHAPSRAAPAISFALGILSSGIRVAVILSPALIP